jgi:hypothetical protein
MADIVPQSGSLAGSAGLTYTAASAGGDAVVAPEGSYLHIKNDSGASITATVNSISACNQGFDHNLVITVPAGANRVLGPLTKRFINGAGKVEVTYSAVTSVTVAALRLG